MAKRLITLVAALLLLGFVAAGCGDEESSNDSGDTAAQTVTDTDTVTEDEVVTDDEVITDTETETETVTDETTTDVAPDDSGGATAVPENLEQAVASCKKAVTSYPQLSEDTRSDLADLCEQSASGDSEQAAQARREVCEKLIEDVYPSGVPGKRKALEACQSSVK